MQLSQTGAHPLCQLSDLGALVPVDGLVGVEEGEVRFGRDVR